MTQFAARSSLTLLLGLIALVWIGVESYNYFNDRNAEQDISAGANIPVVDPPLEPDRPDLIEEPRINDAETEE